MQFTYLIPFLLSIYFCQSEPVVRRFEIMDKNANRSEYVGNRTGSKNGDSPDLYAKCEAICNLEANPTVKCIQDPPGVLCECFHKEYEFDYGEKVCKKCLCGANTAPCRLEYGKPKCDCLEEFYLVAENCIELTKTCAEKCNLPANEGNVICDDEKIEDMCVCTENEKEFDYKFKVCKKCVCGENTKACRLEDGEPKCECKDEYYLVGTECKELTKTCAEKCNLPANEGNVTCDDKKIEDMCVCTENEKKFDYKFKFCKKCVCGDNTEPCKIKGGKPKCDCLTGYRLVNGNCEKEEALSEKCKEKCKLPANEGDVICDESNLEDMCVCTGNGKMFDYVAKDCKECVCGENTKPCRIEGGNPKCECKDGFDMVDGNCYDQECDCGKYSYFCYVGIHDEKKCDSVEGYSEKKGTCEGRYCGQDYNDTCRSKKKRILFCMCLSGYKDNNGTCEECNCGPAGICSFEKGKKVCYCMERHRENNGICEICDCGRYAYGCYFDGGHKKCSCIPGFNQVDGICRNDTCTTDEDCHNGAVCFGGKCECLRLTTGPRCQVVNCNSVDPQCRLSGGSCQYDVFSRNVFCKCQEPKTYNSSNGRCEDPCLFDRCQNGGICIVLGNTFKCLCRASFSGEMCENDTEKMKLALWISCSTVAVLVIIVGITLLIRCQKRWNA